MYKIKQYYSKFEIMPLSLAVTSSGTYLIRAITARTATKYFNAIIGNGYPLLSFRAITWVLYISVFNSFFNSYIQVKNYNFTIYKSNIIVLCIKNFKGKQLMLPKMVKSISTISAFIKQIWKVQLSAPMIIIVLLLVQLFHNVFTIL